MKMNVTKTALVGALTLSPVAAMAHQTSHQAGHLHPHGMTTAFVAVIVAAVVWFVLRRS